MRRDVGIAPYGSEGIDAACRVVAPYRYQKIVSPHRGDTIFY